MRLLIENVAAGTGRTVAQGGVARTVESLSKWSYRGLGGRGRDARIAAVRFGRGQARHEARASVVPCPR